MRKRQETYLAGVKRGAQGLDRAGGAMAVVK